MQPAQFPIKEDLNGQEVHLSPLLESHAPALYEASHGSGQESLWTYLSETSFETFQDFEAWIQKESNRNDWCTYTVKDPEGRPLGMFSLLRAAPQDGSIEVGRIWYTPSVQRTKVNTETLTLVLEHLFEHCGYRRVEWKCNAKNLPSRRAARRLGFSFEGLFRQHKWVKGENRDTAWYAMTKDTWPEIRSNLHSWLYEGGAEQGQSLTKLNAHLTQGQVRDL